MRFSSGIPFVLMTLESAQLINLFAAVLYDDDSYKFGVERGRCVNLKGHPVFEEIEVGLDEARTLYKFVDMLSLDFHTLKQRWELRYRGQIILT
ncbi:hypothetical protein H634G_10694 [Metarhizium anisopliae BRIP 53293]|uniref:Fungal-type protein kinase domain-containing protein n=1 Tax=Metarhizium anisopliae BRIP 53293 TaxID=1291518 RepID=A0A0D9NJY2_METAN|nr:hypothetical protein H634G_10694 [Metarhizium anisopliae BRIP 53293]KJK91522.1 hypothetical protein H633G_04620 [Metarhizium anisopliae BRIP 53284]